MPARKIGRILSLSFPLPGTHVDNYNFFTAPSFFDYDAVVVDPAALSQLIESAVADESDLETFAGRRIRNEPSSPGDVSLADVLLRRREETRLALESGVVIVCFVHAPVTHTTVAGAQQLDDYYWLCGNDDASHALARLVPADGSRVHVIDYQHPLSAFVHSQLANISYRAYFDLSAQQALDWRVFAHSGGAQAVALDVPAANGRIILLPALAHIRSGVERYALSDELQTGIRRAVGVMAEGRPPQWLASHPLPDLDQRATAVQTARDALAEAQSTLDRTEREHNELARYQRLLWQEGEQGLDDVVLDALRLLGFEVYANDPAVLSLRFHDTTVLLEIEADERLIDTVAHHRLRQRIERAIEQRGTAPRGLLIVNGLRLEPPCDRPQQVTNALRIAAETMRYCIATTSSLFAAVNAKLAGDDDAVAAYRDRIITTDGYVD